MSRRPFGGPPPSWVWGGAVFVAIALFTPAAHALGTAKGTTISNVATIGASNAPDTTALPADTTVTAVYGGTTTLPADKTFAPGDTATFSYQVMNNGNATDTFAVWIADTGLGNGASTNWRVYLSVDTGTGWETTVLQNDTKYMRNLAADAVRTIHVSIVSDAAPSGSPDGSFETFTIVIQSVGNPTATQYTGDNGTTYSVGGGETTDIARATISAAKFTLTKAIDTVTLGGAVSAPVPGATIHYKLTYDSVGSATPTNIVLYDSVPANTTFDTASYAGDTLGSLATFHASDSSLGWVLQYATVANPDQSFGSADYSTTLPAGTVTWIRWVRTTLPVADKNRSFWYRVIIK